MTSHKQATAAIEQEKARLAVQAGTAFIKSLPNGDMMIQRISTSVDIEDGHCCTLAMATGMWFHEAVRHYKLDSDAIARYGFNTSSGISFAALTRAWRAAVR